MCKLLSVLAIILVVTCYHANGQIWTDGICRNIPTNPNFIPPMPNFDIARFIGVWNQQSGYNYPNQPPNCAHIELSQFAGIVGAINVTSTFNNGTWQSNWGHGLIPVATVGQIFLTFNASDVPPIVTPVTSLTVVWTDYESLAIVWSCIPATNVTVPAPPVPLPQGVEQLWILTRAREPELHVNFALTQLVGLFFQPNRLQHAVQNAYTCGAAQIYAGILLALITSALIQFLK